MRPVVPALACIVFLLGSPAGAQISGLVLGGSIGYRNDGNYVQVSESGTESELAFVGLFLNYRRQARRFDLDLSYGGSMDRQLEEPKLDTQRHAFSFGMDTDISRRSTFATDLGLVFTPQAIAPAVPLGEALAISPSSDQFSAFGSGEYDYRLTRMSGLSGRIRYGTSDFENPALADNSSLRGDLGVWHQLGNRTYGTLRAGIQRDSLPSFDADTLFLTTEIRINLGRRDLPARRGWARGGARSLVLGLGGSQTESEGIEDQPDSTSVLGRLEFTQTLGATRWSLGARVGVPGVGTGQDRLVQSDVAFAGLSHDFGRSVTAGIYGSQSIQTPLAEDTPVDYRTVRLTLDWSLISMLGISADYAWFDQESEDLLFESLSFQRWSVSLVLGIYNSAGRDANPFRAFPRRLDR